MVKQQVDKKKSKDKQAGHAKVRQKKVDPLEPLKMEIAAELGLSEKVKNGGWDSLSAREAGKIGGHMTHRLKAMRQNNNQLP